MDSVTEADIDRIFKRLETQIDLSKVKNKRELFKKIRENPKTRKWNKQLNDLVWDINTFRDNIKLVEIKKVKVVPSKKQKGYVRQVPRRWSDYEVKFLIKLRDDKLKPKQIALQIHRTLSSVYTKLHRISKKGVK